MKSKLSIRMVFFFLIIFYVAVPYKFDWTVVMMPYPDETERLLEAGAGHVGRQMGVIVLGFVSVIMINRERLKKISISGWLGYVIILFISLALISILWSDVKMTTFKRLSIFMALWLGAFSISKKYSYSDVALLAIYNCSLTLALSVGAEIILGTFSPFSAEYRFAGVMHPNAQGLNCGLLFISSVSFLLIHKDVSKLGKVLILSCGFASILFLLLTKSRTALLSSILALGFSWLLYNVIQGKRVMTSFLCLIAPFQVMILYFLWQADVLIKLQRLFMLGRDTEVLTLTGRTDLWRELLDYVAQSPLLGYGYDSFWTLTHTAEIMGSQGSWVASDHSSYFNVVLGLGVIGLTIFVIMLLLSLQASIRLYLRSKSNEYIFATTVIIMAIINMFLETILFQFNSMSLVILVVVAKLAYRENVSLPARPYHTYNHEKRRQSMFNEV